jgi:hypothetical protein
MATHTTLNWWITIKADSMPKLKPVHPGEVLREEFMIPFNLNANSLALALRVAPPAVYEIVKKSAAPLRKWLCGWGVTLGRRPTSGSIFNLTTNYPLRGSASKRKSFKRSNP